MKATSEQERNRARYEPGLSGVRVHGYNIHT